MALASRTCAELAALTTDIPAGLIGIRLPAAIRKSVNKRALVAVGCATPVLIGMVKIAAMTPDGSPFAPLVVGVTFVLFLGVPIGWFLLFVHWLVNHVRWLRDENVNVSGASTAGGNLAELP